MSNAHVLPVALSGSGRAGWGMGSGSQPSDSPESYRSDVDGVGLGFVDADGFERDPDLAEVRSERRPAKPSLAMVAEAARPVTLARERTLPVSEPLECLVPGGSLRRGTSISVSGDGGLSLALALAAGPTSAGSWVAGVGLEWLGLAAAAELGVKLDRFVMVDAPPPGDRTEVLAALIDGVDLILVAATDEGLDRRLLSRMRERGTVVISVDPPTPGGRSSGQVGSRQVGAGAGSALEHSRRGHPSARRRSRASRSGSGSDLRLDVRAGVWVGVEDGRGHLESRRVEICVDGRGAAGQGRSIGLLLPGPDGRVNQVAASDTSSEVEPESASANSAAVLASMRDRGLELVSSLESA